MTTATPPLERWEDEGGAGRTPVVPAALPAAGDMPVLAQLGAALVAEWDSLPTAVQRAVYERAVGADRHRNGDVVKRELARFLHDHKLRVAPV